jgi:glycosyltransferase involved in cell wall biosynthesis
MHCPTLKELPDPPVGKTGWPWTAESRRPDEPAPFGRPWPRIGVVTPSFGQAEFLEATIRSILLQGYPNLEYVVMDGESRDGSVEIIRKYEPWLHAWSSAPDRGPYDAINKGFARTGGEVMAWLNSDDLLAPDALWAVGSVFARWGDDVRWISGVPAVWDAQGRLAVGGDLPRYHRVLIRAGCHADGGLGWIQQESTFWVRSLWERAGGSLDLRYPMAADFDLWCRFAEHEELYAVSALLGGFRRHPQQRTASRMVEYREEAVRSLAARGFGKLAGWARSRAGRMAIQTWLRLIDAGRFVCYDPLRREWEVRKGKGGGRP